MNGRPVDERLPVPRRQPVHGALRHRRARRDAVGSWATTAADSSDSRDHLGSPGGGMVPVDKVIGRADWIGWPFGRHRTRLHAARRLRARARAGRRARAAPMGNRGRAAADPAAPRRAPRTTCCPPAPAAPSRRRRRAAAGPSGASCQRKVKRTQAPVGRQGDTRSSSAWRVLIALVLKTFLVQAFVIPSGSMEQTIRIGDRVLVDKLTPWFGSKPQRGDVVVFKDPGGWLHGRAEPPRRTDPVGRQAGQEVLTFIGLLPSDDEQDLIKRVVGGRRRHGQVLRRAGPGDGQRHAARRAVHPPGQQALQIAVRGDGAPGAAVRDGRPPGQLRRLPLPPGRGVQRHRLRGRASWAGPW